MITTFENICTFKIYVIVLRPIFNTTYKGKKQVEKYMWAIHHELFLFQQSRNCFPYVPDNEIEGGILGWNPSLDGISENIDTLVKTDEYGAINTTDTATMGYYVNKIMSETYKLQEETMCKGQISTSGELVVKSQYIKCMKSNTKWYWEQKPQYKNIIVNTPAMLGCHHHHWSKKMPKIICNKNQARKAIQMSTICLTDSDHDFILDKIKLRDTIEYKRKTSIDERCE